MPIYLGTLSDELADIALGTESLSAVYLADTQIWPTAAGSDNYEVRYLAVAGGGGGGGAFYSPGGGAGGMLGGGSTDTLEMTAGVTYTVTVGAGGTGPTFCSTMPTSGGNTSISGSDITTVTAIGGGYAGVGGNSQCRIGGVYWSAGDGGSGGGIGVGTDSNNAQPGTGTSGQGNDGGSYTTSTYGGASGGGGAGAVGNTGQSSSISYAHGKGGVGKTTDIISTTTATAQSVGEVSGSSVYFAGGGGGARNIFKAESNATAISAGATQGGLGGGGNAGCGFDCPSPYSFVVAQNGAANTGGGGGGACHSSGSSAKGGNGGSGVVIFRIPTPSTAPTFGTPANVSTVVEGTDTIYIFKGSSTITWAEGSGNVINLVITLAETITGSSWSETSVTLGSGESVTVYINADSGYSFDGNETIGLTETSGGSYYSATVGTYDSANNRWPVTITAETLSSDQTGTLTHSSGAPEEDTIPTEGLIAEYLFDNNLNDTSDSATTYTPSILTGTVLNLTYNTSTTSGEPDKYISCTSGGGSHNQGWEINITEYSSGSFWVYKTALDQGDTTVFPVALDRESSAGNTYLYYRFNNQSGNSSIQTGTGNNAIATGEWIHFAFTVDDNDPLDLGRYRVQLYENGAVKTQSGWFYANTKAPYFLHRRLLKFEYVQDIPRTYLGAVRLYDRYLTSAEITQLYQEFD